jgi:DNA-binding NarL/FixJ family response regulator
MAPIRIAICDDHPVFRAGIVSVLATEPDLKVTVDAGTVTELMEQLDHQFVDVVLLDLELRDSSGISAVPSLARISRVLILSAFADPARVREAMELGAMGYVLKDASPVELFRCIRDVAAGRTVMAMDLASDVARSLRREVDESDFRRRLETLTARQRQVLTLLTEGKSAREIAGLLYVSEGTAKNHVTRILQALEVPDRAKLVHLWTRYRMRP